MRDNWYYYPSKETLEDIIENDDIDKNVYIKDRYDCDDFVSDFSSNLSSSYLLNNTGTVVGKSTDIKTGITEGHAWNIIIAKEKGEDVLYFFMPQTDEILPVGVEISTNKKIYRPKTIEW